MSQSIVLWNASTFACAPHSRRKVYPHRISARTDHEARDTTDPERKCKLSDHAVTRGAGMTPAEKKKIYIQGYRRRPEVKARLLAKCRERYANDPVDRLRRKLRACGFSADRIAAEAEKFQSRVPPDSCGRDQLRGGDTTHVFASPPFHSRHPREQAT